MGGSHDWALLTGKGCRYTSKKAQLIQLVKHEPEFSSSIRNLGSLSWAAWTYFTHAFSIGVARIDGGGKVRTTPLSMPRITITPSQQQQHRNRQSQIVNRNTSSQKKLPQLLRSAQLRIIQPRHYHSNIETGNHTSELETYHRRRDFLGLMTSANGSAPTYLITASTRFASR